MTELRNNEAIRHSLIALGLFLLMSAAVGFGWFLPNRETIEPVAETAAASTIIPEPAIPKHILTPDAVKGVYMTACTAGHKNLRDKTLTYFDGTELNSLVIDLKDYTGTVSYASSTMSSSSRGCRIYDLPEFLTELHARGIYAIARITVFQDPYYASAHPELAIHSLSRPNDVWRDKNGLAYLDPGATPYWDYIVAMAKEAYSIGFDEINFDYIRFPSDGNLSDMTFTWSTGRLKSEVLRSFFKYLDEQMADCGAIISADLFGLTTSARDDLGIGQVLEDALIYFDYVAPMVYPSHFARGYNGIAKPAEHPYEIVTTSMSRAVERSFSASTTPYKLRPWLQDFNLGATYTPDMVRAQIQATYDTGLTSWMLWNAASVYQKDALMPKDFAKPAEAASSTSPSAASIIP